MTHQANELSGIEMSVSPVSEISAERQTIGKTLYWFAWIVEICAVIIGLAISIMQGISSFAEIAAHRNQGLGFGDYTNVFIAMMPFFMVSVVELTKIPFVGATYKTTNQKWKWLFGSSLFFIAFITFESALNGFERNFHALIFSIDSLKKELVAVEEEIVPVEEQRYKLASLTASKIEAEYSARHSVLSEERSRQADTIQDRIQSLRAATQTEYIRGLKDQIADRRTQIENLRKDRQRELDALLEESSLMTKNSASELDARRRSLQQQLLKEQDYLKATRKKRDQAIKEAGFFSESKVRKRQNKLVSDQEVKVEQLRTQLNSLTDSDRQSQLRTRYLDNIETLKNRFQTRIDALNSEVQSISLKLGKSLGAREKDVEKVIKTHVGELTRIETKFAEQQSKNEAIREQEFEKLAKNDQLISDLDATILLKKTHRVKLRNQINIKVGDNQVYRMAQWWYGKESAADLDRKDVMTIASLWFGSLAMLIAVTGILLAFASYVIRDPNIDDRPTEKRDRLPSVAVRTLNSVRRFLVYRRRLQRKPVVREVPVEVIREVPVEKVVTVEKPIEIIKKEIVHIPLYTDDKSLLNASKNVASDLKDLQTDDKSR